MVQRRDSGRPEIVYGRRCPSDLLEHEVRVAELALILNDGPFERGVKTGRAEPDARTVYRGRTCDIEVDNSGKMTAQQMKVKWKRYNQGSDTFILVVALTEGRMLRLGKTAELVKDRALFTTFQRLQSGMPNPWIDWTGKSVAI